jgi:hypothetical protein
VADLVDRRSRGLLAMAITDTIRDLGMRPAPVMLVSLRGFFRLDRGGVPTQAAFRPRTTAMTIGCVGLLAILVLPVLLVVEVIRNARARRHDEAMRRLLDAPAGAGAAYREHASGAGSLREALRDADAIYAIDWTIWRDGTACFAGSALGVVRGNDHVAPWIMIHRGPPPRDAIDSRALARALPDVAPVPVRCEWELEDPFEAVERE